MLEDNASWLIWLLSCFSYAIPHSVRDNRLIEVREANDDMFVEIGTVCFSMSSPMGLVCVTLQMAVLNAELSAERRDGNGNNSAHFTNSSTRGRTPCLAA